MSEGGKITAVGRGEAKETEEEGTKHAKFCRANAVWG